jgi:hypothetical protein
MAASLRQRGVRPAPSSRRHLAISTSTPTSVAPIAVPAPGADLGHLARVEGVVRPFVSPVVVRRSTDIPAGRRRVVDGLPRQPRGRRPSWPSDSMLRPVWASTNDHAMPHPRREYREGHQPEPFGWPGRASLAPAADGYVDAGEEPIDRLTGGLHRRRAGEDAALSIGPDAATSSDAGTMSSGGAGHRERPPRVRHEVDEFGRWPLRPRQAAGTTTTMGTSIQRHLATRTAAS